MIVVASAVLCLVVLLLASNLAARKFQADSLNSASDDLHQLYSKLVNDLKIDTNTATFSKRCGQSSAKYHTGTITCGPRGRFLRPVSYDALASSDDLKSNIQKNTTFEKVEVNRFDSSDDRWTAINFVHAATGIECFVDLVDNGSSSTEYRLGCNETVPDFLPGYTVEK